MALAKSDEPLNELIGSVLNLDLRVDNSTHPVRLADILYH